MPKKVFNYSKCAIYKIVCNDLSVSDCYVGHTTNFIQRKAKHKNCCNNEKSKDYNLKVYKTIRANGGWQNFSMVLVEDYKCDNKLQAASRERFWYENLKANMNSNVPNQTVKEYNEKYYVENQEKFKETNAKYRIQNQEKLNQQIDCICGSKFLHANKAKHLRSLKHLDFISSNNKDNAEKTTQIEEVINV